MMAQYPGDTARAVEAAVYLHGLAADMAVRGGDEHTLLATDSLGQLGRVFRFRARGANGYVWLQGLPADALPAASREGSSMTDAAGTIYEFTTESGADTIEVGRKLARLLKPPQLLLLRGDLGTGKTTLVKGIAEALDAAEADEVTSPTFTLLHEYDGTQDGKPVKLYHLDVYRLEGERQLETLGLDELLTPDALVLVEWGEKFKSIRKRATGEILITSTGGDARKITVTLKDERS